ncbi:MAG: hypothetical protein LAN71_14455 [Acidobacteriia bacterium]|nr:hypothetical protein [Terriglobia bacterium]
MATMSEVVALMDDLFFQMKLAETAKQLGIAVKIAGNAAALLAEAANSPRLIIVDLNAAGCAAPVVAFLSHVQVDLAERARAAGCDEVMPRSSFTKNLPVILARGKG